MTAVAAKRECVRQLQAKSLSECQACRLVAISTSVLREQPRTDGNKTLRESLKELAGQHRRHGDRMLHDRLRQEGWAINVKRTWRLYREAGLARCACVGTRSCRCASASRCCGLPNPTRCGAWTAYSTRWPTAGG